MISIKLALILLVIVAVAIFFFARENTLRRYTDIKSKRAARSKKWAAFFAGSKAKDRDAVQSNDSIKWIVLGIVTSVAIIMLGIIIITLIK